MRYVSPCLRRLIGVGLALLALIGCAPTPSNNANTVAAEPQITLTVSGSGSTTTVLKAIRQDFEAAYPTRRLELLVGAETAGGVEGMRTGVLDLAAMARPFKDTESGPDTRYFAFGAAPIAFFVHGNLGELSLTREEVAAIFTGTLTHWSDVGGPDLPIVVYVRNEDESATQLLRKAFLGAAPFPQTTARVLSSQAEMVRLVAGTRGSIGFGSWPVVRISDAKVRAIVLDGIAPSDPAYPLAAPLGIGYLDGRAADVQPLIDWLRSPDGQAVLRRFDIMAVDEVAQQPVER